MKTFSLTLLLLAAAASCFALEADQTDRCREANTILSTLAGIKGDELARQEDRILRLCPDGTPGHFVKGVRHERADGLKKLGDELMAIGEGERTAEIYRQLLNVNGAGNNNQYTLGLLYERQGMLDEAEEQYRQTVQKNPKNGDARRHLADIYTLRGNFPQAIQEYRELLILHNDNPLLHFKLARACERGNKYQDAIAEYLETIKLAPNNLEAHKELAALYVKRGKTDEAAEQYRILIQLDKNDVPSRNALISLYVKLKKYDELFALTQEGVNLYPDDPDSHFRLGLMYDFRKDYEASVAEYRKALAMKSDHAKALKGIGKVYFKTGKFKEAKEYLVAAKKADPTLVGASELLNNVVMMERTIKARKKLGRSHHISKKKVKHKIVKKVKSHKKKSVKKSKSKTKKSKGSRNRKVKKRTAVK